MWYCMINNCYGMQCHCSSSCRICFFTANSLNNKTKFIDQVNYSFGGGAMSCGFDSNNHVAFFVQFLKRSNSTPLPSREAVTVSGRQPCGIFALNPNCFIDDNGEKMGETSYVWLRREVLFEGDKIVMDDVTAIVKPLTYSTAVEYFLSLQNILSHNFLPGLLVISGALMSFHYRTVIELYGGCAVTVATGDSGTGKSTSIKAALALFGIAHNNIFVKGTNAGMLERSTRSTLPYGIDDPAKGKRSKVNQLDIGELCVDLYNGQKTLNLRSGSCKPMGTAIIATNFETDQMDRYVQLVSAIIILTVIDLDYCMSVEC